MLNQAVAEAAAIAGADAAAAVSLVPVFPVQVGLPIRVAAPAKQTVASQSNTYSASTLQVTPVHTVPAHCKSVQYI
jgi:hypothetical protein